MARARSNRGGSDLPSASEQPQAAARELVVVMRPDLGLRAGAGGLESTTGANVTPLAQALAEEGASLRPLFGGSEEVLEAASAKMLGEGHADVPELAKYYEVVAPDDRLDALAERLRQLDEVEAAYVKPGAEPPVVMEAPTPSVVRPPAASPDFTPRQGYLNPAPGGIDTRFAASRRGGRGAGIRIIDIEGAWRFTHEDLLQNQGGVVGGIPSTDLGWRNHGTAVIGEFGGDANGLGITGIAPDAHVSAVSIFGPSMGSARAIRMAADRLRPGDIMLLELHRPGPRHNFQARLDQRGYIAIEWWPDDFDAIRYATLRGVIVVEAAGNGAENLDDPIYSVRPPGFPMSWTNPFQRRNRDSDAIVVGAGAPPPGTHGRDHGPDRSRLDFSNYGALVDAQGWGREVTTAGYGDLQGGPDEDRWYTDQFSGTSSASPIIVGAIACVQGVLQAANRRLLTPVRARQLLRSTGSAQQDAPGRPRTQRIGNRPNLRQMILELVGTGPAFEGVEQSNGEVSRNGTPGGVVINIRSAGVTLNIDAGESSTVTVQEPPPALTLTE